VVGRYAALENKAPRNVDPLIIIMPLQLARAVSVERINTRLVADLTNLRDENYIIDIVPPRLVYFFSQWTSQNVQSGDGTPVPNPNPGGYPNITPNDGLNTAGYVHLHTTSVYEFVQ
jgi:hypothetical protein